ncbi:hypothetical protein HMPREF9141_1304 [Prevotella multiformis DSM 16608]|uniref:Uncharacterized protein n=1 Tax=Prevotella multiformis DSM 16608 TaxID=888743 RepID=F0F6T7_9BACT|nr:hypothetical protein HMPREF9141_1304 [Prevotella multiformis DSM 16608]
MLFARVFIFPDDVFEIGVMTFQNIICILNVLRRKGFCIGG